MSHINEAGRRAMRNQNNRFEAIATACGRIGGSGGGKPIVAHDPLSGAVIAIYDSCQTAARRLPVTSDAIRRSLKNPGHICAGYLWRYKGIGKPSSLTPSELDRLMQGGRRA